MTSISTSELVCKRIGQTNTGPWAIATVCSWRDKDPNIFRKVTCGAAIFAGGLVGVIDAVISIALGILTYPLNWFGHEFSKAFYERALFGGCVSIFALTISQYDNLVENKLLKKIQDRLPFS